MPRRKQSNIEGGKVKSLKQIGRDFNKGFDKATKGLARAGSEIGQFTNKQLLPGVVSTGIPLASTALGVVGQEFGLPPELTSSLSSNLMKNYIPKQYQSKSKYAGMFGDALNMALTGDYDPEQMIGMMDTTLSDISGKPKRQTGYRYNQNGYNDITRYRYNPDDPFQDILSQQLNRFPQQDYEPDNQLLTQSQSTQEDYSHGKYEQKEGNPDALLGAGLLGYGMKKRRGRKPKIITEEIEIYTKKKPSYKKFSHAKNTALDQLLEAKVEKEEKEASKAMKKMVEQQSKMLTALGYGIKNK